MKANLLLFYIKLAHVYYCLQYVSISGKKLIWRYPTFWQPQCPVLRSLPKLHALLTKTLTKREGIGSDELSIVNKCEYRVKAE